MPGTGEAKTGSDGVVNNINQGVEETVSASQNVDKTEITDEERIVSGEIGKICEFVRGGLPEVSVLNGAIDEMKKGVYEILENPQACELSSETKTSVKKGRYNSHQRLDYVFDESGGNRKLQISVEKLRDTHPDANSFMIDMEGLYGQAMKKEDAYFFYMQKEMETRKDRGKDFFSKAQRNKTELAELYYAPTESISVSLIGENGKPSYELVIHDTLGDPYVLLIDYTNESQEERFGTKFPISLSGRCSQEMFQRVKNGLLNKCKSFRAFEN